MSRGVVLVYFSRLGGRLRRDQKVMLDVDARAIAKLKGNDFGGHHETARDYSVPVFFVPDDTLAPGRGVISRHSLRAGSVWRGCPISFREDKGHHAPTRRQ